MATVKTPRDLHRALGDRTRARLLELLEGAPEGRSVAELAGLLDLHANTVRSHLGVLERVGLVGRRTAEPHGPGRPPRRFVGVPRGRDDRRADEHELLAAALAGALHGVADGPALAEAAGHGWGRYLVERVPPTAPDEDRVARATELLARRGFAPERDGAGIRMHRCPFRELAERHEGVVCALHRGLLNGALAEVDAPVRVGELVPFAADGTCHARLEPARRD